MPDMAALTAKREMRRRMLAIRRSLSVQERLSYSDCIVRQLCSAPFYIKAGCVFCYAALEDEVQTRAIFEQSLAAGREVCLPFIVEAGVMEAVRLPSMEALVPDRFGILTVDAAWREFVSPKHIDCAIIPGAAFSSKGGRLGMGGGYYDRFLAQADNAYRAAVAFSCQISEKIPVEEHDCYMDAVITEREMIFCNPLR